VLSQPSRLVTAVQYARPHILFNDGVYHRLLFALRVNPAELLRSRRKGGLQWVLPTNAVALHKVWIRSNVPPSNGEERLTQWSPRLEAIPDGATFREPIVNCREGDWPEYKDEFPWQMKESGDRAEKN